MGDEWRVSTWGDEISLEYGKALRGYDAPAGKYRVFGSNGPIGWTSQPLTQGPGVILGRKGAYRGVQYSPEPFYVIDTAYYVLPKSKLDMRWLYYAIKHYKLGEIDDGSPIPSTTRAAVYVQDFDVPPLPEQRTIAHILGTLDDKIELNRQMNETLEAMARALFKSWFVDFEPVRAKAEGRETGLPKDIADLFPDSFENSELGEVPKGWRVQSFAETIEIIGGGTPKTSVAEYWDGDIPWFSVVDAPTDTDIFVVDTQKKITQVGLDRSSTKVLPVGTTIISARGTVGRLALVGVPMTMNQSCYGLRSIDECAFFTYYAARTLVEALKQRSHGSVFDTITRVTLSGITIVVPSNQVKRAFEVKVEPIMQRIKANMNQSRTLATLRDTLLPKLLSGEIRVKDAEKIVKETI
jgi:type I restriction enzyme, S subunit